MSHLNQVDYLAKACELGAAMHASDCRLCRLSTTRTNIVAPVAVNKAQGHPLMIVMSHPTEGDDAAGILTTKNSPKNELLGKWLHGAGITDFYITTSVKCIPGEDDEQLDAECLSMCAHKWLIQEVQAINPRVIVVTSQAILNTIIPGASAFFYQRGMESFMDYMGTFINMKDRLVMPIVSPTYVIASGNYGFGDLVVKALEEAKTVASILGPPYSITKKSK